MITDNIKAIGQLTIDKYVDSVKVDTYAVNNMVVTTGKNYIVSRMKDATATAVSHMAIGSGSTAAVVGDTALQTQLSNRIAFDSITVLNNTITYIATFGPGVATGNVYEAGLFNNTTGGTMLARTVFGLITKSAADTFVITWTITIS